MMFTLDRARRIADTLIIQLSPWCEVINIAGSIRRLKPEVKDIELVFVPKKVNVGGVNLFGEHDRKMIVHPEFDQVIGKLGKVLKGKTDGRMMQIELHQRITLDLFMPVPVDYWRQFAIRTGCADYSQRVIARGWLRIGWCGTTDGLRLQKECSAQETADGKTKWTCVVNKPTLPPVWFSEKEFFDWMNVQWVPPQIRYVN